MPKLTVESTKLENPKWPGISLKPGDTTTMQVDAPQIKPDQFIEFRIRQGDDVIDSVKGAAGKTSATWKVPNLPHSPKLKFDAVLTAKASPKNGFQAVLAKVTSPEADLQGFKVEITASDAAFVPHTENVQITYNVTDTGGAAVNGRYEIWGERYPDDKPLYTVTFTPAAGAKTWSWDGKANQGKNSGKYISPEFSPYRVRIIIGISQGLVDDAFGAGISQVAAAEQPFEVEVESVQIRIQAGIAEAAAGAPANAPYTLAQVLAVEPYADNGNYRDLGRLPLETEPALAAAWTPGAPAAAAGPGVARIRIPMACHDRAPHSPPDPRPATTGDRLEQGGILRGGNYMGGPGAGAQTKNAIDKGFYTRPELPIEFEPRLRSRVAANNTDPSKLGIFNKDAIGPLKIEPMAEDSPPLPTGAYPFESNMFAGVNGTYWKNAIFKVKRGVHKAPINSGAAGIPGVGLAANQPVMGSWQIRQIVAAAGTQVFDLDLFTAGDTSYHFVKGGNELTVWLNRTKLVLGAAEADINKGYADYIEVDNHTLKIRPNFTRQTDVLWVVRNDPANAVALWTNYPPGMNCHDHYGGIRGSSPYNLFLKDYSTVPAGHEPLIGKINGGYPYKPNIDLIPDMPPAPQVAPAQERVEVTAMTSGAQQGLGGVLFSPSFIAGDSYILHAFVERDPYERNLGWIADRQRPRLDRRTGTLSVWRLLNVSNSQRLPDLGTAGLAPTVGCPPETAIALRSYIGDGVNMNFTTMNQNLNNAFNQWYIQPANPAVAPAADVHKDVVLATYITEYMRLPFAGRVNIGGPANVMNVFVPYDHYRDQLPPNIPANRVNAASNVILSAAVPAGTLSATAMAAVQARFAAMGAAAPDDPAPVAPLTAIPVHPGPTSTDYENYVDGQIQPVFQRLLNVLIPIPAAPPLPQPKSMMVIRWPKYADEPYWNDGTPPLTPAGSMTQSITLGQDFGDGQAFFVTGRLNPPLFAHEMGHSVHLAHFVAGNFEWKHHNLLQPDCMMSYSFPTGFIALPVAQRVGPTAAGTPVDQGWPHQVPALPVGPAVPVYNIDPAFDPNPSTYPGLPAAQAAAAAAAVGTPCIRLDANPRAHWGLPAGNAPPGIPCAKCMLKLRGWNDEMLPAAWMHPDLF